MARIPGPLSSLYEPTPVPTLVLFLQAPIFNPINCGRNPILQLEAERIALGFWPVDVEQCVESRFWCLESGLGFRV